MTLPPLAALGVWLADRPAMEVAGKRWSTTDCPLARWLENCLGVLVEVNTRTVAVQGVLGFPSWLCYSLPPDYQLFEVLIDAGSTTVHSVTVGECRAVLARALGDTPCD